MCVCLVAQLCLTLCNPIDCSPPGSSVHGNSPGKNTGMGGHSLLQGIFSTQRSNPGLLHCRWILYHLSHWESPLYHNQFSSVQPLSHVRLFVTPWTAACQVSLSITNSLSLLKFMCIKSVIPSNHLILYCPLSTCLQSFPALGSFLRSQFFASGGQSIEI